ncbi:TRAP transporter large permease subunit [Azospirillum brasilense]|uniref:TRAP transporter large permease subunit n=1 Tax=Azospirillum brasilense TaxID=192 RepID=UPI001FE7482C|nr:TRAP transporter large permease subunit [Azospirillum brasilense]
MLRMGPFPPPLRRRGSLVPSPAKRGPVAFAIGLSALCTILYEGLPVAVIFQQMMSGMNVFSFLAIPFFVFSGELMLHGGVADKIVATAKNMVGHIRGGLSTSSCSCSAPSWTWRARS